ncbi:MAG: hypothetical protein HZB38_03560 [Planctomycetes bacterium]|nr:hypothetical protein [Planctomycetota bacterium]
MRLLIAIGLCVGLAGTVFAQESDPVDKLVERIAKGDQADSRDAADELVELTIGQLAKAIGSLDSRPAEEVERIRAAVGRIAAGLRIRLARTALPEDDRALFDQFRRSYPELIEQLFHDNFRVRQAAVQQIPLDPDTGAGVMLALRIDDEDENVVTAAFEVATKLARLKDPVLARNLGRWIHDVTETTKSGHFGIGQAELKQTLAIFAHRASLLLANCQARAQLPQMLDALRFFGSPQPDRWSPDMTAQAAIAIGKLRDERAASVLAGLLDDPRLAELRSPAPGALIAQTVGDAAFVALLNVYELEPGRFGMACAEGEAPVYGFVDDDSRRAAREHLRGWIRENSGKPAAERNAPPPLPVKAAPATQPASRPSNRIPAEP